MKVSYIWLDHHFHPHGEPRGAAHKLPPPEELADLLTFHVYQVDSIEKRGGDYILNIDVLPNRAHDSLSHKGIAEEIGRLLGKPVYPEKFPEYKITSKREVFIDIREPALCPRYMGVVIENVNVGESPAWLKERLLAVGQRSVNNVVDVTNFVMQETGQPLHVFDAEKLAVDQLRNPHIVVRKAMAGEKLVTLDEKEVVIPPGALVIVDENGPVALAGIKGGKTTGVTEGTRHIMLEAANFGATSVRRTSRELNLRTDSSARFEQGLSAELAEEGIRLAIPLLLKLAGTLETKVGHIKDAYPKKRNDYVLGVSVSEANRLLGTKLSEQEIEKILKQIGFRFEKIDPLKKILSLAPALEGVPYKYGASISYDAPHSFDCSSFTAYLYAQAGIGLPRMAIDQYAYGLSIKEKELMPGDLVFSNTGEGKTHYASIEFMPGRIEISQGIDHVGLYMGDGKVIHATRRTGEVVKEKLATSVQFKTITGYRRIIDYMEKRFVVTSPPERLDLMASRSFLVSGIKEDLIEEIGRVYSYKNIKGIKPKKLARKVPINKEFHYANLIRSLLADEDFSEVMTYAFRANGEVEIKNPLAGDKRFLRKSLEEGLLESLGLGTKDMPLLGLSEVKIFEIGKVFEKNREYMSLGLGVYIPGKEGGRKVTEFLEETRKMLSHKLGTSIGGKGTPAGLLLIDFESLLAHLPEPKKPLPPRKTKRVVYEHISQYPFVLRDVAVWVPRLVSVENIEEAIMKTIDHDSDMKLKRFGLFDEFQKEEKKSLAFHIVFQSDERTLTDKEVNETMKKITGALSHNGWQVR